MLKKIMHMLRGLTRALMTPFSGRSPRPMGAAWHAPPPQLPWQAGIHHLSSKEGAILVRDHGVEIYYPPAYETVCEDVTDTLDFLRFALTRDDWQNEWHYVRELELRKEAEDAHPCLTLLDGGLSDEYEN